MVASLKFCLDKTQWDKTSNRGKSTTGNSKHLTIVNSKLITSWSSSLKLKLYNKKTLNFPAQFKLGLDYFIKSII